MGVGEFINANDDGAWPPTIPVPFKPRSRNARCPKLSRNCRLEVAHSFDAHLGQKEEEEKNDHVHVYINKIIPKGNEEKKGDTFDAFPSHRILHLVSLH